MFPTSSYRCIRRIPAQVSDQETRISSAAHHDRAKRRPVDLCLFSNEDMKTQKSFLRPWTQTGNNTPQLNNAAGVAAFRQHPEQTRGAQPRMLLQRLA